MMSDVKLFVRSLWRSKLYTAVTVFGFAMALTFVILLTAYVRQELSVDHFHTNKDRIFRVVSEKGSFFGPLVGGQLKNQYPEIECYTRMFAMAGILEDSQHQKIAYQSLLVDSAFFRMFSFRVLEGDPAEFFRTKNSVVLTRSYALKILGNQTVVGKEISMNGERMLVTGVVEDMPENTHFDRKDLFQRFDFLADMWGDPVLLTQNNNCSFGLYLMVAPGADIRPKTNIILEYFKKDYWPYSMGYQKTLGFESLTDVYWSDEADNGTRNNSKIFVFILMAIVVLILILALINYTNLSVARAGFRAKEAAIKKLVGGSNRLLFRQFVLEAVGLCFVAFFIALALAFILRPLFDQVLNTRIYLFRQISFFEIIGGIVAVGLLGMISGFIPAWMIVRFNPVDVVKGVFRRKMKGAYGKILICFQYMITMILMMAALVIFRQTDYLRNYDLGFDKENLIWLQSNISPSQEEALRSEFAKIPGVLGVSYVCGTPLDGGNNQSFEYNGKPVSFQEFMVDTAFLRLMNIQVHRSAVAESPNGVYLNQAAVRELELGDSPTEFKYYSTMLPVLGIMKDFHFRDLTQQVGPAVIRPIGENYPWKILIKVDGLNAGQTYDRIKNVYGRFIDEMPFDSGFMDESINQWYERNDRMAQLIGYFSVVSVVLAMMGILAMATYFISQRTKEIGLRRVNGATVYEILQLLTGSFMKWILVAFVLACPVAWWAMSEWLQAYPYRMELSWWIFAVVGIGVAVIALLMMGGQSYKAAVTNPVKSLKSE